MRPFKTLLRSAPMQIILAWMVVGYIWLVRYTGSWRVEGNVARDEALARGTPIVVALWHNRILMMPYAWLGMRRAINLLISGHRDGMMVGRCMALFGMEYIPVGKGAARSVAVKSAVRALRANRILGVTPDGPRGPRMRVKPGIVEIAKLSGACIVPVAYSARRRRVVGSWDRFIIPLPFSGGLVLWGTPLPVPRDADPATVERLRLELEERLTALTAEADRLMGVSPIEPAPVSDFGEQGARA